jgi:hypothetical protein
MRWLVGLLLTTVWLFAMVTGRDLNGAAHLLIVAAVLTVFGGSRAGRRSARGLFRRTAAPEGTMRRSLLLWAVMAVGSAYAPALLEAFIR